MGEQAKRHLCLQPFPITQICLSSAFCQINQTIRFSQEHSPNPKVKAEYPEIATKSIKCTINVMSLTHPETIPPTLVHGKVISTKPVPGARLIRDRWAMETWASHLISLGLSFSCSMRTLIVPTFTGTMGLGSVCLTRGLRICLYIKAFYKLQKSSSPSMLGFMMAFKFTY